MAKVITIQLIVSTVFIGVGVSAAGLGIYAIFNPIEVNSLIDSFTLVGGYLLSLVVIALGFGFTTAGASLIWWSMKWIVLGYNDYSDGERHTNNETIAM